MTIFIHFIKALCRALQSEHNNRRIQEKDLDLSKAEWRLPCLRPVSSYITYLLTIKKVLAKYLNTYKISFVFFFRSKSTTDGPGFLLLSTHWKFLYSLKFKQNGKKITSFVWLFFVKKTCIVYRKYLCSILENTM